VKVGWTERWIALVAACEGLACDLERVLFFFVIFHLNVKMIQGP